MEVYLREYMSISESLSSTTGIALTSAVKTRYTQNIRDIDEVRLIQCHHVKFFKTGAKTDYLELIMRAQNPKRRVVSV